MRPGSRARPEGSASATRAELLQLGLRLAYLTVAWNVVEGVVAVTAAVASGSVALLGFGIDSFIESASGLVMIWRIIFERRARDDHARIERIEARAQKLVAASLVLLAVYLLIDGALALFNQEEPEVSGVGIALTAVSLVVMRWLAAQKLRVAVALGSRAMRADAFQTTACWWLSLVVLAGIALNAVFDWWWADPAAGIAATYFLVREARDAWRGEDDCC